MKNVFLQLYSLGPSTSQDMVENFKIVSEMGYAQGVHRQVLFTIGLVLFGFIMGMNLFLTGILKEKAQEEKYG